MLFLHYWIRKRSILEFWNFSYLDFVVAAFPQERSRILFLTQIFPTFLDPIVIVFFDIPIKTPPGLQMSVANVKI